MAQRIIPGYLVTLSLSYVAGFTKGIYDEQTRIGDLLNKIEKGTIIKPYNLVQNHVSSGIITGSEWFLKTFFAPFLFISLPIWMPISNIQMINENKFRKLKNK